MNLALLRSAAAYMSLFASELPEDSMSRAEVSDLAWQLRRLIPLIEKELRGEKHVCRCCKSASFSPLGPFDETLCGACYNGIHKGHEPPADVVAQNRRDWKAD